MAELGEAAQGLLCLFQGTPSLRTVREAILKQQTDVAVGDADRRSKLMRKHMEDVVYLNRHRDFGAYHNGLVAVARPLKSDRRRVFTRWQSMRILLVDDYPDALEMWGLYLRSMGYDVSTAEDGLQAVEEAHRTLPDIVILDLDLPGITGFEAAIRLRSAPDTEHIPLIAATCFSQATQLDRARQSGFDSILIKPCEPMALVAEVRRLLGDRRPGSEGVPIGTGGSASRSFGHSLGQNL